MEQNLRRHRAIEVVLQKVQKPRNKPANTGLRNIVFGSLLLPLLFAAMVFPQDQPKTMQIDEFSNPNCEELSARLDYLAAQLAANPTATVFISVAGKDDELRNNLFKEGMIKTYFPMRRVPNDRWRLVRVGVGEQFLVKVWIVPNGSSPPELKELDWSYEILPGTRPFIFDWSDYADDICPAIDGQPLLKDVLKANPKAKVNVVLRVATQPSINVKKLKHSKG